MHYGTAATNAAAAAASTAGTDATRLMLHDQMISIFQTFQDLLCSYLSE